MFSGLLSAIPTGWFLCDGNNGTPNLKKKFIIGAGNTYDPNDEGGVAHHTHDFTGDGHWHTIPFGTDINPGLPHDDSVGVSQASGTSDPIDQSPPWYALAFIMLGY